MDKIGRMQKTDLKIFFLLQQFEVAIRVHVQPNFPIVILSLFINASNQRSQDAV